MATRNILEWRECLSGELKRGTPPSTFVMRAFPGLGGGICWEPNEDIGFNPSISDINFSYARASAQFPSSFEFEVSNLSSANSYKITFNTNTDFFTVTPREIIISPRETGKRIQIKLRKDNIDIFGDGTTRFNLVTRVEEI